MLHTLLACMPQGNCHSIIYGKTAPEDFRCRFCI